MPHIPDFPSPTDDDEDGRESNRGSIVDRIIGGNGPATPGN
ncbi:hypothetical protein [Natronorubrum halophilum]|nr:hypothetical protein [Natronorubrum halophilum]